MECDHDAEQERDWEKAVANTQNAYFQNDERVVFIIHTCSSQEPLKEWKQIIHTKPSPDQTHTCRHMRMPEQSSRWWRGEGVWGVQWV